MDNTCEAAVPIDGVTNKVKPTIKNLVRVFKSMSEFEGLEADFESPALPDSA